MGPVQTPAAASPEKLQSSNFRETALLAERKKKKKKTQSWSAETHLSLTACPAIPRLPGVTGGHRPKDTALQIR